MKAKQPKDGEVASLCIYHDAEGFRNAWGLYDAVKEGTIKPGTLIIAEIDQPVIYNPARDKQVRAIVKAIEKMSEMTAEQIEEMIE